MIYKTSFYRSYISVILLIFLLHLGYCYQSNFVERRGSRFVLNGRSFYLNGFNAYWLMLMASDPSTRIHVTNTFEQASLCKMNLARTWAFSDGVAYKPLQISPGSYNEEMFEGLDFVLSEAKKHGIYLILSLVNNWKDFGGKSQYVDWAKKEGQPLGNEDEFFTNSVVKEFFKNHVQIVLTRVNKFTRIAYKDDPTIFAWELMNEPRCSSDLSGSSLQNWIEEMASHVKSIDENHMLEIGLEGFYGDWNNRKEFNPGSLLFGTDFIRNNLLQQIDFATIHLYPDQWMSNSTAEARVDFVNKWLESHIEDSFSVLEKPFVLAEFGQSLRLSEYNVTTRENYYAAIYETIYICARNEGPCGGAIYWQAIAQGIDNYGDGYEVVLEGNPTMARIITQQSQRLESLIN